MESKSTSMFILLVTHPEDVDAKIVLEDLQSLGPESFIFPCKNYLTGQSLGFTYLIFDKAKITGSLQSIPLISILEKDGHTFTIMHSEIENIIPCPRSVLFTNIAKNVSKDGLHKHCSDFGNILRIEVGSDDKAFSNAGIVHFENSKSAALCMEKMSGYSMSGQKIYPSAFPAEDTMEILLHKTSASDSKRQQLINRNIVFYLMSCLAIKDLKCNLQDKISQTRISQLRSMHQHVESMKISLDPQKMTTSTSFKFDMQVLKKNVLTLNKLAEQQFTYKKMAKQLQSTEILQSVVLIFYANGILWFNQQFRSFDEIDVRQCIKDLLDGYFPSEFQTQFPNGVMMDIKDQSSFHFPPQQTRSFPVAGYYYHARPQVVPTTMNPWFYPPVLSIPWSRAPLPNPSLMPLQPLQLAREYEKNLGIKSENPGDAKGQVNSLANKIDTFLLKEPKHNYAEVADAETEQKSSEDHAVVKDSITGDVTIVEELENLSDKILELEKLNKKPLTAVMLASAPPAEQKQMLGEALLPLVQILVPNHAEKVTCTILENNNSAVLHLLESPESLICQVEKALCLVRKCEKKSEIKSEDPGDAKRQDDSLAAKIDTFFSEEQEHNAADVADVETEQKPSEDHAVAKGSTTDDVTSVEELENLSDKILELEKLNKKPLTAVMLASAPLSEQKQMLREALLPQVQILVPNHAEKITGTILENDNSALLGLLESPESLICQVQKSVSLLGKPERLSKMKSDDADVSLLISREIEKQEANEDVK